MYSLFFRARKYVRRRKKFAPPLLQGSRVNTWHVVQYCRKSSRENKLFFDFSRPHTGSVHGPPPHIYSRASLNTTPAALALAVLVDEHWNMTSSPVHTRAVSSSACRGRVGRPRVFLRLKRNGNVKFFFLKKTSLINCRRRFRKYLTIIRAETRSTIISVHVRHTARACARCTENDDTANSPDFAHFSRIYLFSRNGPNNDKNYRKRVSRRCRGPIRISVAASQSKVKSTVFAEYLR